MLKSLPVYEAKPIPGYELLQVGSVHNIAWREGDSFYRLFVPQKRGGGFDECCQAMKEEIPESLYQQIVDPLILRREALN